MPGSLPILPSSIGNLFTCVSAFLHCSRQTLATESPEEPLPPLSRTQAPTDAMKTLLEAWQQIHTVSPKCPPNKPQLNFNSLFCSQTLQLEPQADSLSARCPRQWGPPYASLDGKTVGHGRPPNIYAPTSNSCTVGPFSITQSINLF